MQELKQIIDACVSILMIPINLGDGITITLGGFIIACGVMGILMNLFHGIFD